MSNLIDLTGRRYGGLSVVGRAPSRQAPSGSWATYWRRAASAAPRARSKRKTCDGEQRVRAVERDVGGSTAARVRNDRKRGHGLDIDNSTCLAPKHGVGARASSGAVLEGTLMAEIDEDRWARLSARRTENDRFMYDDAMARRRRTDSVIAYLRVSTEEQAVSGLGLADQRRAIENAATSRGWTDVQFVADEGHSARSLDRPAIASALAALASGEASVLVVSKLDRLSRSLLDFATLMEQARREGWELVVLDLAIDTTVPSGALMANVMASFAEYERQIIGARTSAALQQLKSQGVRLGRPRQMPEATLDRIVGERAEGGTLKAIADGLNRDGVPTARGGAQWYPSTVRAALQSRELDAAVSSGKSTASLVSAG